MTRPPDFWAVVDADDMVRPCDAAPDGCFPTREAAEGWSATRPGSRVTGGYTVRSHDDEGRPLVKAGTPPSGYGEKPADPKVDGASSQAAGFPSTS